MHIGSIATPHFFNITILTKKIEGNPYSYNDYAKGFPAICQGEYFRVRVFSTVALGNFPILQTCLVLLQKQFPPIIKPSFGTRTKFL